MNRPIPGLPVHNGPQVADVRVWLKEEPSCAPFSVLSRLPGKSGSGHLDKEQSTFRSAAICGRKYFGFFYPDGARFALDCQGREVWADWPEHYTIEDASTYLLGPVMGFLLRLRGAVCLHASAVVIGEHAIALVGSPGAGKSTTAAAFAKRGFAVLSDDVVVLEDAGNCFFVQPAYPRVNLWPDSVRALFGTEDALPRITPTWNKCFLALGQNGYSFAQNPLRLRAVYVLSGRGASVAPVIEDFTSVDAFMCLLANTYVNHLLDRDMRTREFDVLGRLVTELPTRRVRSFGGTFAVASLCDAITADMTRLDNIEQSTSAACSL